jgi:outer membrane lipoprotein-sorting protein
MCVQAAASNESASDQQALVKQIQDLHGEMTQARKQASSKFDNMERKYQVMYVAQL